MVLAKYVKNIFKIIFILLLYSLFIKVAFADSKPKDIILEATGKGSNEAIATNNALNLLSQQIYVNIKNTTEINESLKNNNFYNSVNNNTVVSSTGFFQNISIYNKKNSSKNSYEVTVGLNKQSLISTADYLFLQLTPEKINDLYKDKLLEQLNIANFLLSLINYLKANNIVYNAKNINLKSYISNLNNIINSDSKLKILVYPANIQADVNINNNTYKSNKDIYLGKGKYSYEVKAKGFKNFTDNIELYKGDNLTLEVYLQKQLLKPINVKIKIINNSSIKNNVIEDNIELLILNNQMIINKDSKNYIEFSFSQKKAPAIIKGYNNAAIEVKIKSFINKKEKIEYFTINILQQENSNNIFSNVFINQFNKKSKIFFARLFD